MRDRNSEIMRNIDNQNIENSLASQNVLVRIFAVLDRRVGKRRLKKLSEEVREILQDWDVPKLAE